MSMCVSRKCCIRCSAAVQQLLQKLVLQQAGAEKFCNVASCSTAVSSMLTDTASMVLQSTAASEVGSSAAAGGVYNTAAAGLLGQYRSSKCRAMPTSTVGSGTAAANIVQEQTLWVDSTAACLVTTAVQQELKVICVTTRSTDNNMPAGVSSKWCSSVCGHPSMWSMWSNQTHCSTQSGQPHCKRASSALQPQQM